MDQMIVKESYGSTSNKKLYMKGVDDELKVVEHREKFTSVSSFFRDVFLPKGYPESVSGDYMAYQIWDTVQAFASSITSTLATQAVLKGVGVGDENATVMAATITWLMKDGTGMLGRIMFAWLQGTYLDCDCKRWRLFADILNDTAILLDICAPMFQEYFTLIVCISGVLRSIVGVAGGATRAAVTQHQARRNNMADVSAKDGSQETLVNLAALLCSLALIPVVTGRQWLIWLLFVLFTGLHIFANYSAVTSLRFKNFNQSRLHIVVMGYLTSNCFHVPEVNNTNKNEPVFWKTRRKLSVHLGLSLWKAVQSFTHLTQLKSIFKDAKYLVNLSLKPRTVGIVLDREATTADMLKACFQAEVLEYALQHLHHSQTSTQHSSILLQNVIEAAKHGDELTMLSQSHQLTVTLYPSFESQCQAAGWDFSQTLLCADEWRMQWGDQPPMDKKAF